MALMERVSALIRANLNDLVDKAEEPETMLKQVILDMENQLIQVKTQVAIAIADEHLLAKKRQENGTKHAEWMRRAEMALDRNDEELARAAIERAEGYRRTQEALDEQLADQRSQADMLRTSLRKLEQKLAEARERADLLIAEHRRSQVAQRAAEAGIAIRAENDGATFERMRRKVMAGAAEGAAALELAAETLDERFEALERNERIEQVLSELKARRQITAG